MTINTIYGPMDAALLVKKEDSGVTEYYYEGELVHRSVEIRLTGLQAAGIAKKF